MRNWMKQLNRVIVLSLVLVCLFGCISMKAEAVWTGGAWTPAKDGVRWWYRVTDYSFPSGGWAEVGTSGSWYYFDSEGYLKTMHGGAETDGWLEVGGKWYHVDSNNNTSWADGYGRMQTGWLYLKDTSGTWWYFFETEGGDPTTSNYGKMAKNTLVPADNDTTKRTMYVNSDGHRQGNLWVTVNGYEYWIKENCIYKTGWHKEGSVQYYLGDDGKKVTGWSKQDNLYYYLDPDSTPRSGAMVTGWKTIEGDGTYYLSPANGAMWTGKGVEIDKKLYYLDSNGRQQLGWQDDGRCYRKTYGSGGYAYISEWTFDDRYVDGNGYPYTGYAKQNNVNYYVENGYKYTGWKKLSDGVHYFEGGLPQTRTLTVKNTITGTDVPFSYTIDVSYGEGSKRTTESISLKHNGTHPITLPKGSTYTIKQTTPTGYTLSGSDTRTGTLSDSTTVTFSNEQQKFNLTITNDLDGMNASFAYSVVIGTNSPITFSLEKDKSYTIEGVPYDVSYSITQTAPDGYTYDTGKTVTRTGTMTASASVTFTNTQLVTLRVANTVTGAAEDFTYTVEIQGRDTETVQLGKDMTSKDFTNIPYGYSYKVTQSSNPGYTTTPESRVIEGKLTSEVTNADFTNTLKRFTLTVQNVLGGDFAQTGKDFVITVTLSDRADPVTLTLTGTASDKIENIPYGTTYSVTEANVPSGYAATYLGNASGTLTDDTTVTVTNTQETSVLKVINDLSGNDASFSYTVRVKYADGSDFPLAETDSTFTLGLGGAKEITIPKNATYTIEQTGPENYTYRADTSESVEGNVGDGATVTFENTQILTLTVVNNVVGADNTIQYTVTVGDKTTDLELTNNTSGTVDVPYGSGYTIQPVLPDGYTFLVETEGNTSSDSMTQDSTVTFTNTQLVTLTLNAQVIGSMANEEQPFNFQVDLYTVEGETTTPVKPHAVTPGEGVTVNGDNGLYTMSMKAGQNVAFTVPYGTQYTITQEAVQGYITYADGQKFDEDQPCTKSDDLTDNTTTVVFTNEKKLVIPTGLTVAVLPFLGMVLFGGGIGITQLLGGRKSRRGRYLN